MDTDYADLQARPFATDKNFVADFAKIKHENNIMAAAFLKKDCNLIIDPNTLFDVQVKRIHEYKRQLLNAFNIMMIYNDIKKGGEATKYMEHTTFLFGGKAAPGYVNAKLIIKLINNIANVSMQTRRLTSSCPSISCPTTG